MGETYEIITSSQNKYVSLARSLGDRKIREKNKLFRYDGIKLLCEGIRKGVRNEYILIAENEYDSVFEKAEKLYGISEKDINCHIVRVTDRLFERLSEEKAPEGVICVAKYMDGIHRSVDSLGKIGANEKILLLESVRDPQNVGAIIRVAVAFGVDRIVMGRDCADIYNSKTVRASMGTLFGTYIDRVADIPSAIREIKSLGRRVFAAALDRDAERLGEFERMEGDCVIIGNEGHGLTSEAIEACGKTVFIPMADGVESLNAATAAAVLVWEFFGSV